MSNNMEVLAGGSRCSVHTRSGWRWLQMSPSPPPGHAPQTMPWMKPVALSTLFLFFTLSIPEYSLRPSRSSRCRGVSTVPSLPHPKMLAGPKITPSRPGDDWDPSFRHSLSCWVPDSGVGERTRWEQPLSRHSAKHPLVFVYAYRGAGGWSWLAYGVAPYLDNSQGRCLPTPAPVP